MTEAPDLDAVARAGAVPALRFAPRLQPDARGSRRRSPAWRVPEAVKTAVWQRDDHSCRFCGFRSLRYQEVLVGGGNARDPDQMGTVCMFCHQCQHLELAGEMRSGVLLWLPEIAQTDLNWMLREVYVAIISSEHEARARRALDALLARREPARERLGTAHPGVLARQLREAQQHATPGDGAGSGSGEGAEAAPSGDGELPAGIRLMALDRRILRFDEFEFNQFPQVLAYWRSAEGPYAWDSEARRELAWLARLEAVLFPAGGVADGLSTGASIAGGPGIVADPAAVGPDVARGSGAAHASAPSHSTKPPPTHARLSARLLRDAATFFLSIADQNPSIQEQMASNATVYGQVADLLEADPLQTIELPAGEDGRREDVALAVLGARLLRDAATFFESVGEQNAPLREQMHENAEVFRALAGRLLDAPLGVLEG